MSADAISTRIKRLPPLPLVAHKLVALMAKRDCSADDVTKLLSSDQALAGKVLRLANSSFYGMSGQVSSISRAVVIIGFAAIRSLALGLGMAQAIRKAASNVDLAYFWTHALFVASAARTLAHDQARTDPEEAFIAGLIHDLGRLVLEMEVPGLQTQIGPVTADRLLDAETEATGLSHTKAGQKVMRHWKLPEALVHLARFHHHPSQYRSDQSDLTAFVQLAELMARSLDQNGEPCPVEPSPEELAGHLGLSLRNTDDLFARTYQEVTRTRAFLEVSGVSVEFENPLAHLHVADPDPSLLGTAVYLGTDEDRAGWVRGLLRIQAWEFLPMRECLADDTQQTDLAIVDPRNITPDQAAKLVRILRARRTRICSLGPVADLASVLPDVPELPVAFRRDELLALRSEVSA